MADSRVGVWRERLVAVLSLLTSFALAPVSLVPAALLAVMVGALSSTTVEVVRGTTPADWRLLLLSAATLGSVPVATLLARLGVHIHKRRAGACSASWRPRFPRETGRSDCSAASGSWSAGTPGPRWGTPR